ncbi:MAG: hypothetical protein DWQ02_07525 [Bacteroidetes bacterium]|nr:MAG: hypothetical protein DWQ02_07525 [Bacteroidota bacterium]
MQFKYLLILSGFSFLLMACPSKNDNKKTLDEVTEWMTGAFSSAEQAQQDSAFYDISLRMFPIWEDDDQANWLYVEQAVTAMIDKPYRQRIYRVTIDENGMIESKVYELPDPASFVHAWKNPEIFSGITPESLIAREGCAVFLEKISKHQFKGATKPNACISTLRGASYATSEVEVQSDRIISWDRGWNDSGEQVWGAVKAGYIFKKLQP